MNDIKEIYDDYLKEKFFYTRHKSGLEIIFVPKKFSTYYALLGTRYGSVDSCFRYENEDTITKVPDGIAHYLEHKMFESPDGADAFERFSELGANANAFTTHNLTAYLFSCTSMFEESLLHLLSFVSEPYFTDENVEKERGIIAEEIEMYEDDPYSSLNHEILQLLYKNNPVRIGVAGTVESVSEITPELLYKCYNAFYTPSNMILSVCGDTNMELILSVCDKVFGNITDFSVERCTYEEQNEVFQKRKEIKKSVSKPLFCIGIKDTVLSDAVQNTKKSVTVGMMMDMLFGSSSPFYVKMYSESLISSMNCGYDYGRDYAFGYLIGECESADKVYSEFRHCVDRVGSELTEADFNRIKKVTMSNFVKTFDNTENIATDALCMKIDGIDIYNYADVIASIDFEYVKDVAKDFFSEKRCAMMTVIPQESRE